MNKRIKQKVAKRIINKIGTEKPLTYFERKYFIKFFWKPLKKVVTEIAEGLEVESEIQIESMKETFHDLTAAEEPKTFESTVDEWTYSSESFSTEEEFIEIVNLMTTPVEPVFYEPSKWQKAKDRVKGWFGK